MASLMIASGDQERSGYNSAPQTEEGLEEVEDLDVPLAADLYGASVCALAGVFHAGDEAADDGNFISGYVLWLLGFNFLVQTSLAVGAYRYVALPQIHAMQDAYAEYHAEAFDADGSFNSEKFLAWGGDKHALCQFPQTFPPFAFCLLLLWVLVIFTDVFETCILCRCLIYMRAPPGSTPCANVDDGAVKINFMKPMQKRMCIAICFVRLTLAWYIVYIGYMWLDATMTFADLILNSLALGFIVEVDNILLAFAVPSRYTKKTEEATLTDYSYKKQPGKMSVAKRQMLIRMFGLWFSCGGVLGRQFHFFDAIPGWEVLPGGKNDIREHCQLFSDDMKVPCLTASEDCFPYGKTK